MNYVYILYTVVESIKRHKIFIFKGINLEIIIQISL